MIDDIIIEWYWLIAGIVITSTFMVLELRSRGHLKFNRELTKNEAGLFCFCIGLPCFIPFILYGLTVLFFSIGSPPQMEPALYFLFLVDIFIKTVLVPLFFALFLKVAYEDSGVAGVSFILSLLFSAIYVSVYVQLSIDFYSKVLFDTIPTFLIFIIIRFPMQAVLGNYLVGNTKDNNSSKTSGYNTLTLRKAITLIFHLAKKAVEDNDQDSLRAIIALRDERPVYFNNAVIVLKSPELGDSLSGDTTRDLPILRALLGNESYDHAGRFWLLFGVSFYCLLQIDIWTFSFLSLRDWFFLIPITLFFLVPSMIYFAFKNQGLQDVKKSNVSNSESYLLTKREFRSRCLKQRVAYVVNTAAFLTVLIIHHTVFSPTLTSLSIIITVIYLLTLPLALRDLIGCNIDCDDIVLRVLDTIPKVDKTDATAGQSAEVHVAGMQRRSSLTEQFDDSIYSLDIARTGGISPRFDTFLKRVKQNKMGVYEEQKASIALTVVGFISFFVLIFLLLFMDIFFLTLPSTVQVVITITLALAVIIAVLNWRRIKIKYGFRGLGRPLIARALSDLEIDSNGIKNVGFVIVPTTPEEFRAMGFALRHGYGILARKTRSDVVWPRERLIEAVKESRLFGYRSCMVSGIITTLTGIVLLYLGQAISHNLMSSLSILALVAGPVIILVGLFNRIVPLPGWLSEIHFSDDATLNDTFNQLVKLIASECKYCIRLLVVGKHENLYYTDRIFRTSSGQILQEAILIPDENGT